MKKILMMKKKINRKIFLFVRKFDYIVLRFFKNIGKQLIRRPQPGGKTVKERVGFLVIDKSFTVILPS
jgi:hypothetical protein